jgi:hypothetical protein
LGEDVGRGWAEAWVLHVEGFHERRLSKEDVIWGLKYMKKLLKLIDSLLSILIYSSFRSILYILFGGFSKSSLISTKN